MRCPTALVLLLALLPGSALALEVRGNQLVEQGQPVVLRGIAVGDVMDLPAEDGNPYPEIAGGWGANAVRISIHPGVWRDRRADGFAALRRHVEQARAAGLYVILDYHAIGFPDGYVLDYFDVTEPDTRTDYYDTRFDLALDFWRSAAATFRDPGILFELWNESVADTAEEEAADGSYWQRYRPYWQRLTEAIRETGNGNVVLAAPALWAFDLRGVRQAPLDDANTAYTWHVYGGVHEADWAGALDGLDRSKPVVVTEWGFEPGAKQHWRGTAEDFGAPFIRFMDAHGLSSTAWCWNPDYGPSLRGKDGTPTVWGGFAREYLRRHAG